MASIAGPCKVETTTYNIDVNNESFYFLTSKVLERGYTLVAPSVQSDDDIAHVAVTKGEVCEVMNIRIEVWRNSGTNNPTRAGREDDTSAAAI